MNVNLDNITPVNLTNLRQGTAFGFDYEIVFNGLSIDATEYNFELIIYLNGQPKLRIANADWAKSANRIQKLYTSFPLPVGNYTYALSLITEENKNLVIIPGTLKIIARYATRY